MTSKQVYMERWRAEHKQQVHESRVSGNIKTRFGGNRETAILRDGEMCVRCGMTRAEHRVKFGRDITVDHIDGKGFRTPLNDKNNNLNNLQTLCLPCHGRKDSKRRWES